jgi:hypothetical protein
MFQKERSNQNAGRSAEKHETKRPPSYIAAENLSWYQNGFDDGREHQADSNCDGCWDFQKEH